jgi:simple sugar transport system substrate-binding protein
MFHRLLATSMLLAAGTLSASAQENLTLGVVLLNGDTYFSNVAKGVSEANPGGETIVVNYNGDAGKEASGMDNLITRQVNAILTSPLDPASSVPAIRRAHEAGIAVICYNTCINDEDAAKYVSAFILSDQAGLGRATGEYAVEYIKNNMDGKIVLGVLTCDSFDICRQRKAAFLGELEKGGIEVEIVADQEAYVVDKSVPIAENILTANPQITALWAANDGGTVGLVRAVQSAGRAGSLPVFGTDMTPQLGEYLLAEPPVLLTTTGQDGLATGKRGVEVARDIIASGNKPESFVQIVPVASYTREKPDDVKAYLSSN